VSSTGTKFDAYSLANDVVKVNATKLTTCVFSTRPLLATTLLTLINISPSCGVREPYILVHLVTSDVSPDTMHRALVKVYNYDDVLVVALQGLGAS
jgi:hypothetical protein